MGSVTAVAGCINRAVTDECMPVLRRLAFAWGLFFQVLFSGRKAAALAAQSSGVAAANTAQVAASRLTGEDNRTVASVESPASATSGAVMLLALFQQEGRLVDFLQQELTGFEDAEVGAVARTVHEGCRKVLQAHVRLSPIRDESEGDSVSLPVGFDARMVKLTGDVAGEGTLTGVLRHRGWKAEEVTFPQEAGGVASLIVCPAEVEL